MSQIGYEEMRKMLRLQRYRDIASYEKVVGLGIDSMWGELCSKITTPDVDPTEIFSEEMEYLRNLEYSMKLMNICCLSETWEQDLYSYLHENGLTTVRSNDYANIKRIFEQHYSSCAISNYPKIIEMRALVNAIKHGEGNSLTNVRALTSDSILADSNVGVEDETGSVTKIKQIEFDPNTMTSRTLNVDGKLQEYSDAIVKFWEDVFEVEKTRESTVTCE